MRSSNATMWVTMRNTDANPRNEPRHVVLPEGVAPMLDCRHEVLVAATEELELVVPSAFVVVQRAVVLVLAQKLGAPDVGLVAQRVLPRVDASASRRVSHPLARIIAHTELEGVVDGEARAEHDAQVGGDDMGAVLLRLREAAHPLVGAAAALDREAAVA